MILVTGGTGLVGSHLLFFLLKNGEKVRAIHRKDSNLMAVKNVFSYFSDEADTLYSRIEWVEANLIDIPALEKAFHGIKKVYHAAAYVSFDPKNFNKLHKSNIEGTANIVNLCLHHKIDKLCHISSIAAVGKDNKNTITEEMHWNADEDNNVYAITKYGAEMEVWRGTQEGLNAVIVNPGVILGGGYWKTGTGNFFSRVHKGMKYYTTGEMGFVDVIDVVQICIELMESDINSQRYILVSENASYKTLFTKIATAFKTKPPYKKLKPWILKAAWRLNRLWSLLTGKKQMLFRSTVEASFKKSQYSNHKITQAINHPFIPLSETIGRIVSEYEKDLKGSKK